MAPERVAASTATHQPRPRRASIWLLVAIALWLAAACQADPQLSGPNDAVAAAPSPTPSAQAEPSPTPTLQPEPSPTAQAEPVETPPIDQWVSKLVPPSPVPARWLVPFANDPRTVETALANGIRVILRENDAPGGQAQLRLVIDAGSIEEDPAYLGSAHFLEHMMFNGTEKFPGNDLIPLLESFGSAFGADVNAYTSFSETVYELTTPSRNSATVVQGVDVLAEWAHRATIDPGEVDAERGIVREEWRRRAEQVGGRIAETVHGPLFAATPYLDRLPIGTRASIDAIDADALRAFYETWYRPELMTVIVVGDIDLETIQRVVEDSFSPVPAGSAQAPKPVDTGGGGPFPEPVFDVFADPELTQTGLEIIWRVPSSPVVTPADLSASIVAFASAELVNDRLFSAGERASLVASSASASLSGLTTDLSLLSLEADLDVDDASDVVHELVTVVEQIRQHGVTDDELGRVLDRIRAGAEQELVESARVQDSRLAHDYVGYALDGAPVVEPQLLRDTVIEIADRIEVDDIRRFIDGAISTPPYVLLTTPASADQVGPDPESLAAAFERVHANVVPDASADAAMFDELMERPEPAVEVDRTLIPVLDTLVVTYENGVRVASKISPIAEGQVDFQAWSRGGFFHEEETIAPLLSRASDLVLPSGFESRDIVEVERLLGDTRVGLSAEVSRATETLEGSAAVVDLETLMQLIHLQMTEPTISEVAVRRFDDFWRPLAEDPSAQPALVADLELWRLRYGDSPYFRLIPTVDDLDKLDVGQVLDAWNRRFANPADFVFVFVGDTDHEQFFDLAARYLGTLPASDAREAAIDRDPGLPEENRVATVATGIGDRGEVRINWESPFPFTMHNQVAAELVEVVVNARLRDVVREELGASYAPRAAVTVLGEPKPWVDSIIEVEGDPDRVEEISAVVHTELERLRAGDFDVAYLERAKDLLREDYRFSSNIDYIDRITLHLAHPDRPPGEFTRRSETLAALTVDQFVDAVATIFPEQRSVEVRLIPGE